MLSEEDPLGLKEIYDPDGTDEAYSVRYVFSEQNNQDKPDGIILGNDQAVDGDISIRDINNCLINNDSTTQEFKNIDLTMQQKNTFNELFDYVRMLEDVGGNVNPVFIFDEYLFANDNPSKEVYIVEFTEDSGDDNKSPSKNRVPYGIMYNNIKFPVKWQKPIDNLKDVNFQKFKEKPFTFTEEYDKSRKVKSIITITIKLDDGEEFNFSFENVKNNHPNMFKNFFGSSFKKLHVDGRQQQEHFLIGNKRVLVETDVADKEYFLKKDMEVTFMPRVCDNILGNKICFTISFTHNITGKKITRSIEVTEPKFLNKEGESAITNEELIERLKEFGGIGQVNYIDEKETDWGDSYSILKKLDEKKKKNSLLDKETIAKNMKTMHLEFIIKKEREKEEKEKKRKGQPFKYIGDIKVVMVVGEIFGKDQDVVLYRYGKPYIIIKNIEDNEIEEDPEEAMTFAGQIPSIQDFYYNSNMLEDIRFNINLKYTKDLDKGERKPTKVECCNRIILENERLKYKRFEDGDPVIFSNEETEIDIVDKIKDKFKFEDIFFDNGDNVIKDSETGFGPGRVIKLIDPNEGKYIPPEDGDDKEYLNLEDGDNLEKGLMFYDKNIAMNGKRKYSDQPKPVVFFDIGDMQLSGIKATNIEILDTPINIAGQSKIDERIEEITMDIVTANPDSEDLDTLISDAIDEDQKIKNLQEGLYVPEYTGVKDAIFKLKIHKNMVEIKLDKYLFFLNLDSDQREKIEQVKRLKGIKSQKQVVNKNVRILIKHNEDDSGYKMKIVGRDVQDVEDIKLSGIEKIHVFQSDYVKLRTPMEQKSRRKMIQDKKDGIRDAEKRKQKIEDLKADDAVNASRFSIGKANWQRLKNSPGSMYRGLKSVGERLRSKEVDEFEEFPLETNLEHKGKEDIKLIFRENYGTGAEFRFGMIMKELKEESIKIQYDEEGNDSFVSQESPIIDKTILYNYSQDPDNEYTTYGLYNKTLAEAMYGESKPKKVKQDKSKDILGDSDTNLWTEDDYEKPISEKGRLTGALWRAMKDAASTALLYTKIGLNKTGAKLPSFENFGLITPYICVDDVPIIEEPVQVNWIYNEEKTGIMVNFQKMYLKEITKLYVDAEEDQDIKDSDLDPGKTMEDFEKRKKNVKNEKNISLCGLLIIRKILRRLASSMPNINTEVVVTGFKRELNEKEVKEKKYNFEVRKEYPLVEVKYNFYDEEQTSKDVDAKKGVNRLELFINKMIKKHLSSVIMQTSPSCVKPENREKIEKYVKAFFFENLKKTNNPEQAEESQTEGEESQTEGEEKSDFEKITSGVKITEKQLSNLLDFRFKISRDDVFNDSIKFKQFQNDFMEEIINCLYYNNVERISPTEKSLGDRGSGGIGYDEIQNNLTIEIARYGLGCKFKNDNKLISEYREKLLRRFIKTIEGKLAKDDVAYEKLKGEKSGELLTTTSFSARGLYNLILRLTCGMYFTVLHGSNFMDYDILSIAQYKRVMDKLWLDKWNIAERIKPNTLVDMLSIDNNYWEEMCEIEKESFVRNRVAFFVDYVEKDKYYRDVGLDPTLRRQGLWGEKAIISAEKKEASYSTRDSKYGDSPLYSANKLQYIYRGRGNTSSQTMADSDSDSDDEGLNDSSIMKKNIYCAEIDNTYEPLEYDKQKRAEDYDKNRAGYYHIYDDIVVPHLSSGTTWKYIDDEEHRVDVNEATFDKEPKTNANVRFILYQDQINFIKYFVNLKIIPIYHYFDTFMDSFCMLASKIVDDQSYEVKGGELNKMDGVYTSVDVLNYKAFYKLLESDNTSNSAIDIKKRRIESIAQKYDEDMKKKEDKQQAEQQIDEEKSTKQKIERMVDKAKESFENIKLKHTPNSDYDSGVGLSGALNKMTDLLGKIQTNTEDQNISRVTSGQNAAAQAEQRVKTATATRKQAEAAAAEAKARQQAEAAAAAAAADEARQQAEKAAAEAKARQQAEKAAAEAKARQQAEAAAADEARQQAEAAAAAAAADEARQQAEAAAAAAAEARQQAEKAAAAQQKAEDDAAEAAEALKVAQDEEAKERKLINLQSQLLRELIHNPELVNIIENDNYKIKDYEQYEDLVRKTVELAKQKNAEKLIMADISQQANNLTEFPGIDKLDDNIVNRNRIRTYGDGNCLFYSIMIIGFTQNIQAIKDYFTEEQCGNLLNIHNNVIRQQNQLQQMQAISPPNTPTEEQFSAKRREIEETSKPLLKCIKGFKEAVKNFGNEKLHAIDPSTDEANNLPIVIQQLEDSLRNYERNWADTDLIGLFENCLDIKIRCIKKEGGKWKDVRDERFAFKMEGRDRARKTITIYYSGGGYGHFEATNFLD